MPYTTPLRFDGVIGVTQNTLASGTTGVDLTSISFGNITSAVQDSDFVRVTLYLLDNTSTITQRENIYIQSAGNASTVTVVARGQDGTSTYEWPAGSTLAHGATAEDFNLSVIPTTGDVSLSNNKITDLADGVSLTDAASVGQLPANNLGNLGDAYTTASNEVNWFPRQTNISKLTIAGHSFTEPYYGRDQSLTFRTISTLGVSESQVNYVGRSAAQLIYGTSEGGWLTVITQVKPPYNNDSFLSQNGVSVGVWGINDAGYGPPSGVPNDTQGFNEAYSQSLESVMSRFRTSVLVDSTGDGSWPFSSMTPSYTNSTSVTGSGATGFYTPHVYRQINNGGTVSFQTPSSFPGGTVAIGLIGHSQTTSGGTINLIVKSGSTTIASVTGVTTSPTYSFGAWSGVTYNGTTDIRYPIVYRFTNLPSGTLTISGNVTSNNVDFDYWQIESFIDNPIIIQNITVPIYATIYPNDSNLALTISGLNDVIDTTVSSFTTAAVANVENLYINVPQAAIVNDLHPSPIGTAYMAEQICNSYVLTSGLARNFSTPLTFSAISSTPVQPMAPLNTNSILVQSNGTVGNASINQDTVVLASGGANSGVTYFVPVNITKACTVDGLNVFLGSITNPARWTIRLGLYYDYLGTPINTHTFYGLSLLYQTNNLTIAAGNTIISGGPSGGLHIPFPGVYWMALGIQYTYTSGNNTTFRIASVSGSDNRVGTTSSGILSPTCYYTKGKIDGSLPSFGNLSSLDWAPALYMNVISIP